MNQQTISFSGPTKTGAMGSAEPTEDQAEALVRIARDIGGISVDSGKRDFIRTRLGRLLRSLDFEGYDMLIERAARSETVKRAVLEALTTHTTSFFREANHFDWLRDKALPEMLFERSSPPEPLTIWSAACSNGAELWTAGIVVSEFANHMGRTFPFRLVGSDVSERILKVARGATFTDSEVEGVPAPLRSRYFLRADGAHAKRPGHIYRVTPSLREKASFRHMNLLEAARAADFKADIIFLRNVLIYFDPRDRDLVVRAMVDRLHTGGALLTGHSEAINARRFGLKQCAPSTFRKV